MAFINHEERVMDKCKCDDCERDNDGLGCARGLLFALPLGLLLWGPGLRGLDVLGPDGRAGRAA